MVIRTYGAVVVVEWNESDRSYRQLEDEKAAEDVASLLERVYQVGREVGIRTSKPTL